MVDLGLFNFVKNAVAQGQTKEVIAGSLTNAGWSQETIDEAYTAVVNNTPPTVTVHAESITPAVLVSADVSREHRPIIITAICGYYFIGVALSAITFALLAIREASQSSSTFSTNFTLQNLGGTIATILSFVGIWQMRKWGVYLYTVVTIASIGILTYINFLAKSPSIVISFLLMLPFPVFAMYVGFKYLNQMS
jgi:hypothetical protein